MAPLLLPKSAMVLTRESQCATPSLAIVIIGKARRWAALSGVQMLLAPGALRADEYCEVCKAKIVADGYLLKDDYHKKSRVVCKACTLLPSRCLVCTLPVLPETGLRLPDGRAYCAEDLKLAVMTEEAATALFAKAREEAMAILSPYPPLALRNIETHLVT